MKSEPGGIGSSRLLTEADRVDEAEVGKAESVTTTKVERTRSIGREGLFKMRLSNAVRKPAEALFILSLMVLFGTLSLRWLVSDTGWYESNFDKNLVPATTGIVPDELARAAGRVSGYLLLQRDRIDDITVNIGGLTRLLFNDREIRHMRDVRALLRGFYTAQYVAAGYVLLYLAAVGWLEKGSFWVMLGRRLRWAGLLTIGLFGLLGVLSVLNFDALFLQFHLISFDNNLWQLDPTRDNLIMMFPQPFWYDSALRLAITTGAQGTVAMLVGTMLTTLSKKPLVHNSWDHFLAELERLG